MMYGEKRYLSTGFLIEAEVSPGFHFVCNRNKEQLLMITQRILHTTGYAPPIHEQEVPQHNDMRAYCIQTPMFIYEVTHLIPQQCVIGLLCRNFGIILRFANGINKTIPDVTTQASKTLIQNIIGAQGLEVRRSFRDCKTSRCVLGSQSRLQKRSLSDLIGGTHCGGFLVYMYCPHAADVRSVSKLAGRIGMVATTVSSAIQDVADLQTRVNQAVVMSLKERESWMNSTIRRINDAFEKVAKYQVSSQQAQQLQRSQEGYARDLAHHALSQRVKTLELMSELNWFKKITLSVAQQDTSSISSLLAERDYELADLLQSGYVPVVVASSGSEAINIAYSKPYKYTIHIAYIPYRPYFRLEEECSESHCERCVSQIHSVTKLETMTEGSPTTRPMLTVTPFNITPCQPTGAPNHLIIQYGDTCINITIDKTSKISCPARNSYPLVDIHVPSDLPVAINYTEYPPLVVPYVAGYNGTVELTRLMEVTTEASKRIVSKMSSDLNQIVGVNVERGWRVEHEARTGLILGSISLTIILARLGMTALVWCYQAHSVTSRVGYMKVEGVNKASRVPRLHRVHEIHLERGPNHITCLIHTSSSSLIGVSNNALVINLSDGVVSLGECDIISTKDKPCNCPDDEILFVTHGIYPPLASL
nr:TPA_asm: putative glycoprotein [Moniex tapwovirus]